MKTVLSPGMAICSVAVARATEGAAHEAEAILVSDAGSSAIDLPDKPEGHTREAAELLSMPAISYLAVDDTNVRTVWLFGGRVAEQSA